MPKVTEEKKQTFVVLITVTREVGDQESKKIIDVFVEAARKAMPEKEMGKVFLMAHNKSCQEVVVN